MLLGGSCTRVSQSPPEETPAAAAVADSVEVTFHIPQARGLDLELFIYDAGGLRSLERHSAFPEADSIMTLTLTEGDKTAVAIADPPGKLNVALLGKYETMEQLTFRAADDSPLSPAMTGTAEFAAGDCTDVNIDITPLFCSVVLAEIRNSLEGYRILEDPRICLTGCNPSAEALRRSGFRPSEQSADTLRVSLPCDVGIFAQYPDTQLWCYPNDTPEYTLGTPRTEILLECSVDGETLSFSTALPPLGRGSLTRVAVEVASESEAVWKIL